MGDAIATCECCGAELRKPRFIEPYTLGERCAKNVRDTMRYMRDSARHPEMYPIERVERNQEPGVLRIARALHEARLARIAARRAA